MPTRKLYYEDAYLKHFEATITEIIDDDKLLLDQTAFYPGGGGQPPDTGFLQVNNAKIAVTTAGYHGNEDIAHVLDLATVGSDAKNVIESGIKVEGSIDWNRRFSFMRYHTALHILSAVMVEHFNAPATGGQMYENRARMDFKIAKLDAETVKRIETLVNKETRKKAPVKTYFISREELEQRPELIRTEENIIPPHVTSIRVVEIEGIDVQADGGLHVKNTKELEEIRIVKRENRGKGHKRLYIKFVSDM